MLNNVCLYVGYVVVLIIVFIPSILCLYYIFHRILEIDLIDALRVKMRLKNKYDVTLLERELSFLQDLTADKKKKEYPYKMLIKAYNKRIDAVKLIMQISDKITNDSINQSNNKL